MNYIELINNFWDKYHKTDSLNTTSIALYFHLVDVCNEARWTNPFKRRNDKIESDLKMTRNTLVKARETLSECGLISFTTYNGVANVEYTLSNIDNVAEKEEQSLSNSDKVDKKACQNFTSSEETLSNNDEVSDKSSSKNDKVEPTLSESLSETLSKNDSLNINSKHINNNKENNKKKESKQPYQNLTRSIIPTKNEVIDFFMSQIELTPAKAENLAESFFSYWSAENWRDGKSIIFDWIESAKNWKGEPKEKKELTTRFTPPTVDEVKEYCEERNNGIDAIHFFNFYQTNGWMQGKSKIKDWKACVITWERNNKKWSKNEQGNNQISTTGANTNRATASDKRASREHLETLADDILEQYKS